MELSYNGTIISIVSNQPRDFDAELDLAHHALSHFRSTRGSTWGSDGVGYSIQKQHNKVVVHKSGVSQQQHKMGWDVISQCQRCQALVRF